MGCVEGSTPEPGPGKQQSQNVKYQEEVLLAPVCPGPSQFRTEIPGQTGGGWPPEENPGSLLIGGACAEVSVMSG